MNQNETESEGKKERVSQSTMLVSITEKSDIELFHDEYQEPYVRYEQDDCIQYFKIRSRNFKRWISNEYWKLYGHVPNNEALNSALNTIEGKACFEGSEYKLENRIAFKDNELYYDLGNWTAVRVNKEGWNILSEPPILFRSYNHQKRQIEPDSNVLGDELSTLEDFMILVNIKDPAQKLLFLVSLHCMFLPHIPRPIIVLHGDQGTAKTTTSTIIKELVDPSNLKNLRIGHSYAEFIQQSSHHYLLPLDNLTTLPGWMSDALCRLVTGEGFSKRELYTDDDDMIYSMRRCIILNGINLVPSKPDLLDRSLIFELDAISKNDRIDEKSFWEEFNEIKPRVLGAIFSNLSKAINIHPKINLRSKPRMADFARWGAAIAEVLGHTSHQFIDAYEKNISIQNTEALEASPIAKVVFNFMETQSEWSGSATDLYEKLDHIAESLNVDKRNNRYPNDPNWLWRRLKEVKPNLAAQGIMIEKDDRDRSRGRIIRLIKDNKVYVDGLQNVLENGVRADLVSEGQNDSNDTSFLDLSEEEQERKVDEYFEKIE